VPSTIRFILTDIFCPHAPNNALNIHPKAYPGSDLLANLANNRGHHLWVSSSTRTFESYMKKIPATVSYLFSADDDASLICEFNGWSLTKLVTILIRTPFIPLSLCGIEKVCYYHDRSFGTSHYSGILGVCWLDGILQLGVCMHDSILKKIWKEY
jgi:hypothetical protein